MSRWKRRKKIGQAHTSVVGKTKTFLRLRSVDTETRLDLSKKNNNNKNQWPVYFLNSFQFASE